MVAPGTAEAQEVGPPAEAHVAQPDPLQPDTTFMTLAGVEAALLANRTSGLSAFALAVRLREEPHEAGAARLLAELARRRVAGAARRIGASFTAERVPYGVVYAVSGPQEDADYLAYLLRLATHAPDDDPGTLAEAYGALARDLERRSETPDQRLLRALVERAAQEPLPPQDALPAPDALYAFWARTHRSDAMSLVVESGLPVPALVPIFGTLGAGDVRGRRPPEVTGLPAPAVRWDPPLRRWYGEAWVDPEPLNPAAEVAAAYLGAALSAGAGAPGETELAARTLRLRDRALLVLTAAAYPRGAGTTRARISGAMTAARSGVDPALFRRAHARVRLEFRNAVATPLGRVVQVALGLGLAGDPEASARFLEGLERLTADELTAYLRELVGPYVEELLP